MIVTVRRTSRGGSGSSSAGAGAVSGAPQYPQCRNFGGFPSLHCGHLIIALECRYRIVAGADSKQGAVSPARAVPPPVRPCAPLWRPLKRVIGILGIARTIKAMRLMSA